MALCRVLLLALLAVVATSAPAGNWSQVDELIVEAEVPPPGNVLTLDFFYGPKCGHCLDFMRLALIPLLEAGLPGDRVKVSVLPFVKLEDNIPVDLSLWDSICRVTDFCYYALAPICALKVSVPAAVPVDNIELSKAVRFAECNQARRLASHPNGGMEVTTEMAASEDAESRQCAQQAAVAYDGPGGIKACADGPEVMGLLHSAGYTDRIRHFEHVMEKSGEQQMPYVFLNGAEVLRCDESDAGVDCSGIWTPPGTDRLLKHGGSLLRVVCSRLHPAPAACSGVSSKRIKIGPTPKCENCVEVGRFHWGEAQGPSPRAWRALVIALGAGAAVSAAGLLLVRRRLWREEDSQPEDSTSEPIVE